ncbi:hypothetical protein NA57DRAFT_59246 [Rhizodiscina lignyota]|uniref:Extracellular membrane protein CFEM domain-containing protein n=1 Tax=Rhizodiscina lignyota TaxID=1504668 RepID=A0A9P4M7V6_9PEZI|nr:hypothetical protein NA57DRAFT_59246 [Rhizodiscina lignyota]
MLGQRVFSFHYFETLPLLLLLLHDVQSDSTTATLSISQDPAWIQERACGQRCVWIDSGHIGAPYSDIVMFLDCPGSPYLNGCFCRTDFETSVTSFLGSCVSSRCSSASVPDIAREISTALSIWSHYCSTAAGVVFPSVTSLATSGSSSTGPITVGNTATERSNITPASQSSSTSVDTSVNSTQTTTSSGKFSDGSGLSESDKIAIGVGLGMGIPSILIALVTFVSLSRRRRAQE